MTDSRRFFVLLGAVGAGILLHQLLDLWAGIAGLDLATPAGRMGLTTTLWARGPALLAADLALIWAALGLAHRRALGALAAIHLGAGVLLLLDAPFFLSDAGRMASAVAGPGLGVFRLVVIRVLLMLLLLGAAAVVAGRTLRALGRGSPG